MWGSRIASLAVHAILIGMAVRFSGPPAAAGPYRPPTVDLRISPQPNTRAAPPAGAPGVTPSPSPGRAINLTDVPTAIPPIAAGDPPSGFVPAEPGLLPGSDSFSLSVNTAVMTAPIDARVADEGPRLLSHPPLRYPEVLRQAGVEGRVMVEAVLDTTGRVEDGSLRVQRSDGPPFERAALELVRGSRYAAARHSGRAVRVRIVVPVVFSLRR